MALTTTGGKKHWWSRQAQADCLLQTYSKAELVGTLILGVRYLQRVSNEGSIDGTPNICKSFAAASEFY